MNIQLMIAAGGQGRRLGLSVPKALAPIGDRRLVAITLERIVSPGWFMAPAIIIVPEGWEDAFRAALDAVAIEVVLVPGGAERQESVMNGLAALSPEADIVVIHDAARPFAPEQAVTAAIEAAAVHGAATLATPVSDTILLDDGNGFLDETPDRARVWACQTPQIFQTPIIRRAHEYAAREGIICTDDATLVRHTGCQIKLIDGGPMNIKITTARDLEFAGYVVERQLI